MAVSALAGLLLIVSLRGVVGASSGGSSAATTDTVSVNRPLSGGDARLVSNNSKFSLGFFQARGSSALYLGIWFSAVPDLTTVWVANAANPVMDGVASPELAISADGNLAVFNRFNQAIAWSTNYSSQGRTTNTTVIMNSGNLVLLDSSDHPRNILWQSFDHATDTLLPSAKLGHDKRAGLNRRLVSSPPSPGAYCYEVDAAAPQLVLRLCDSATTYWTSGVWNGQYFAEIPELSGNVPGFKLAFVYDVTDEAVVMRNIIHPSGQSRHQVWLDADRGWTTLYATPQEECDVYGTCGPNTVCSYSMLPLCACMKGFAVRSPEDWEQEDWGQDGLRSTSETAGCVRETPLNCTIASSNTSASDYSGDKFYAMAGVSLPDKSQKSVHGSLAECAQACLNNCSCSAYSYGGQGCLVWTDALLNAKLQQANGGETLYLRLAASEMISSSARSSSNSRRRRVIVGPAVGGATAASAVLVVAALMVRSSRRPTKGKYGVQGGAGGGLVAFRYRDLRSATKNFSEKIGQGGFGSVFKGQLGERGTAAATDIAVKRLDGSFQGEKQFRAEVSSIGVVRHVNLVKLVGFCCDGDGRFLVYEHVPNRSLDIYLFPRSSHDGASHGALFLDWSARYRIAVGVARGLAYLHEACRDRIIHCDVKPQNILLDASLRPKIADFGMAKFVGRDFSRVLTTMRGTIGYLAPEWISGTPITPKVDVYSYGMVLLELVSGTRNASGGSWIDTSTDSGSGGHIEYFPMRASRKLMEGDVRSLLDERLRGEADLKEVERTCKVAFWCIQDDEAVRPAIGQVVQILEGMLELDILPPLPRLLENIFMRPPSSENTSIF